MKTFVKEIKDIILFEAQFYKTMWNEDKIFIVCMIVLLVLTMSVQTIFSYVILKILNLI